MSVIDAPADLIRLKNELIILTNYFHPEPTGSAPPITDLAAWAAEHGLSPRVVTARPSYPFNRVFDGYQNGLRDLDEHLGVEIRRVPSLIPNSRGILARLASESSFALSAFLSRRRRYEAVVCICPSIFTVCVAPLFARPGGRVLAIVHDIQSGLGGAVSGNGLRQALQILRRLEVWALNRCDFVVTMSEAMAAELVAMGVTSRLEVIPPQVDLNEIRPRDEHDPSLVVYSGNLGLKQGLGQVLDLATELLARSSSARIVVRGEGSERSRLEQVCKDRGLRNVSFTGLAPRDELGAALAEAAVHLVPQAEAGAKFALPSKIFSIMAARRPFVATAMPGTTLHQVCDESGGGVCVPPESPEAFADAVEALLSNPSKRATMGHSGRAHVERAIDRNVLCPKLLALMCESERPNAAFVYPEP